MIPALGEWLESETCTLRRLHEPLPVSEAIRSGKALVAKRAPLDFPEQIRIIVFWWRPLRLRSVMALARPAFAGLN